MAAGLLTFALLPMPAAMLRAMPVQSPATIGGQTSCSWTLMPRACLTAAPAGVGQHRCLAKWRQLCGRATTIVLIPTPNETFIPNLLPGLGSGIWLRPEKDRGRKRGLLG